MIKHIVMWKMKEEAEGRSKIENMEILKKMLEDMRSSIDLIQNLEVGLNLSNDHTYYDIVLYSEFSGRDELNAYAVHPEHVKVKDFLAKVRDSKASIDYEVI